VKDSHLLFFASFAWRTLRWVIFDQVQWGLPIGPFRLALGAAFRQRIWRRGYFGSLRERIDL
jgi:hypothetical protein